MTITIAPFSLCRYVHSQSRMNLQLRYHLGFALLSLLSSQIVPHSLLRFSPFPRTSNAILYLLAACRNSMVFLHCCVPATNTNVVVKTVNSDSDRVRFFRFRLRCCRPLPLFILFSLKWKNEREAAKAGHQRNVPCAQVWNTLCVQQSQAAGKKKANQAAQQQANQEDMQQRHVTAAAVSALAAACLSLSVAMPPPAGLDRIRLAPVFCKPTQKRQHFAAATPAGSTGFRGGGGVN